MITFLTLITLVILHELGHFLVAKLFKVKVLEFGIGLPPKAKTLFKRGDTEYSLNWIPLGGFVRLYGDQEELSVWEKLSPQAKAVTFSGKRLWQKILILLAGVVVNLVIGIVIFSGIYAVTGIPKVLDSKVRVEQVFRNSPASISGIKPGDVILRVNGAEIKDVEHFIKLGQEHRGSEVQIFLGEIDESGKVTDTSREILITGRVNPPEGEGGYGVVVSDFPNIVYEKKSWYLAPFYGMVEGTRVSIVWMQNIFGGVLGLFGQIFSGQIPRELSGPIGIFKVGQAMAKDGLIASLSFAAVISINLGIFNLLPLPALDGGRIVLVIIEKIVGRKRSEKYEFGVQIIGFLLLIILALIGTWTDLFGGR